MASLRVPAGMILEDNASRRPALPGLRFSVNAAPGDRSLGFALQTFKRSHPDYVVDESHVPGYILYPRASACMEALEKRVTAGGRLGGLRQFRASPDVGGEGAMKARKKPRPQSFAAEVGRALRRAGVAARRTARMHGTPVYVWKNGKVVAEKP